MTTAEQEYRDLLERAAKAAGYVVRWHGVWQCFVHEGAHNIANPPTMAGQRMVWVPLDDDGDALRLAVKLNIQLAPDQWNNMATCFLVDEDCDPCEETIAVEMWKGDPLAATRRAIVRAAAAMYDPDAERRALDAAIGEAMP